MTKTQIAAMVRKIQAAKGDAYTITDLIEQAFDHGHEAGRQEGINAAAIDLDGFGQTEAVAILVENNGAVLS